MTTRTLGMIKPNATKAGLEADIFNVIEQRGFAIIEQKRMTLTRDMATQFYAEHKIQPWFDELLDFMTSGEIVAFVLEGDEDTVQGYRTLMGATDPELALPDTLRKIFAKDKNENSVHGSDSPESAAREIAFFFGREALEK